MKSPQLAPSSSARAALAPSPPSSSPTLACSGGGTAEPGDPEPMPDAHRRLVRAVAVAATKLPVLTGGSATIEVTRDARPPASTARVTLAPVGLPPQATATFAPETLGAGQTTSTLTVIAPADTPHSLPTAVTVTRRRPATSRRRSR